MKFAKNAVFRLSPIFAGGPFGPPRDPPWEPPSKGGQIPHMDAKRAIFSQKWQKIMVFGLKWANLGETRREMGFLKKN